MSKESNKKTKEKDLNENLKKEIEKLEKENNERRVKLRKRAEEILKKE